MLETYPISPYTHYAYATLRTRGMYHVFDTMRYESAFFINAANVEDICAAIRADEFFEHPTEIILGRYAFSKDPWTDSRLLNDQEFGRLRLSDLFTLSCSLIEPKPKRLLKYKRLHQFQGTVEEVVRQIFSKRWTISTEDGAHEMERAMVDPSHSITVELVEFMPTLTK